MLLVHGMRTALFLLVVIQCVAAYRSYKNYKLLRVDVDPVDTLWLEQLAARYHDNVDIWTEPGKVSHHADILVSPRFFNRFVRILDSMAVKHRRVLINDIQKEIDRQMTDDIQFSRRKRSAAVEDDGRQSDLEQFQVDKYHSYGELVDYMYELARKHADIVGIINVTKSFEKRDLLGLKIGKRTPWKPTIFIDAGIHAREWIAPATAIYVAHKLITEYGKNDLITRMVDKFDWFIVPVANPDGYEYSISSDRLWRKTRSKNDTLSKWCVGADANRNWGYRWGEAGANASPCSNIYAGSMPFSEPEVAGIRDFITWQVPDLKLYISLHSYGQIWLAPWGYTNMKPSNHEDQKAAALRALDAITNSSGVHYEYGTIADLMYQASGTSIDYMQDRGVPYIYGVELRPEEDDQIYGFTIPARFIKPTGEEMLASFLALAEYIIEHKKL
uniref:Peptidase M14 carboxypeptidase A domain-containing protein n=1 Tax=Plectus sambesii TaxID=2011161 RepID=A0A914URK5_9BILA